MAASDTLAIDLHDVTKVYYAPEMTRIFADYIRDNPKVQCDLDAQSLDFLCYNPCAGKSGPRVIAE